MAVGDWEVNQGSEGNQKRCTDTGSVYMSTLNMPLKQQQQQQRLTQISFFLILAALCSREILLRVP